GADNQGNVRLWETETGKVVENGAGQIRPVPRWRNENRRDYLCSMVSCIRFTPDGRWIMTAGGDYTVRLWNARTCRQVAFLEGRDPHQDILWAGATSQTKAGKLLGLSGGGSRYRVDRRKGESHFVRGAADYAIRLWDLQTGKVIGRFTGHGDDVTSL